MYIFPTDIALDYRSGRYRGMPGYEGIVLSTSHIALLLCSSSIIVAVALYTLGLFVRGGINGG